MADAPPPMSWAVQLRVHSVIGLPESDPLVQIDVTAPGDADCKWTSATQPSISSTALINAWATLLVRGSDQLRFRLIEKAPMMNIRANPVTASASVDLAAAAAAAAEEGGAVLREFTLTMEVDAGRRQALQDAAETVVTEAGKAAERLDAKLEDLTGRLSAAAADAEAGEGEPAAAADGEVASGTVAAAEATPAEGEAPPGAAPEQPSIQRSTSLKTLYAMKTLTLRVSMVVTPLDRWEAAPGALPSHGAALEQDVTPLPRALHSYAHGGFMGLACSVLGDPEWSAILKEETPRDWAALQRDTLRLRATGKGEAPSVAQGAYMVTLENSPVMCAYGLVRTGCTEPEAAPAGAGAGAAGVRPGTALLGPAPSLKRITAQAPPSPQAMSAAGSAAADAAPPPTPGASLAASAALRRYEHSMSAPNTYGYRPLGMEWDIWVSPGTPEDLGDASILHGTSSALVTQTVLTTTGLKACARRAGKNQIVGGGMSPVAWLTAFGRAINRGANGDAESPLPLAGPEQACWRLHVTVDGVTGLDTSRWWRIFVEGDVDSDDVVLQPRRTPWGKVGKEGGAGWQEGGEGKEKAGAGAGARLSFWPLPQVLSHDDLMLSVKGTKGGVFGHRGVGFARVPLAETVAAHPELLTGGEVAMEVELEPWVRRTQRRINVERAKDEEDEEVAPAEEGVAAGAADLEAATPSRQASARPGRIAVRLRLESVGVIAAMEALGVPRAAAQTSVAMLSSPGGLYLDVKSAYSTAYDMQVFVSTLLGIGISTKAVCSFQAAQLRVGAVADTVLFHHGLSGVENACDGGAIPPGQFVLFNGASFLADVRPSEYQWASASAVAAELGAAPAWPLDEMALHKWRYLCERYALAGGIYVQEPDTAPAAVDALAALVASRPEEFPLGFAYGHLSGRAVGFFDAAGRGFASQQIVEEFAARKDLSGRAVRAVAAGDHLDASLTMQIVWAGRLLHGEDWMAVKEQRALCALLAEMEPEPAVATLVGEVGGVERLAARFHSHYELTTPLTLLEAGFNWNYTKSLLRLLRNRGVLAALPLPRKLELAAFFVGPAMRGYGATYVAQASGARRGLHKHAKEGVCCLLESCTASEAEALVAALGGRAKVVSRLRGWLRASWHYTARLAELEASLEANPKLLPYKNPALRYAGQPPPEMGTPAGGRRALAVAAHTRDKSAAEQAWRATRKSTCCAFTTLYTLLVNILTFGLFCSCCVAPRCCGGTLRGACGMPAVVATVLGFILAMGVIVLLSFLLKSNDEEVLI